jgi:hypothetical protein
MMRSDRDESPRLLEHHRETGEPLTAEELDGIVAGGVTTVEEWEQRGGGCWWHSPSWPEPAESDSRPAHRLSRARRTADEHDLWGPLTYMDSCPLGCREGGGDADAMRRYMVVTSTDGGEDGWVEFEETVPAVEDRVNRLLGEEWGLAGVWDLDGEGDDLAPLPVTIIVQIGRPPGEHHDA